MGQLSPADEVVFALALYNASCRPEALHRLAFLTLDTGDGYTLECPDVSVAILALLKLVSVALNRLEETDRAHQTEQQAATTAASDRAASPIGIPVGLPYTGESSRPGSAASTGRGGLNKSPLPSSGVRGGTTAAAAAAAAVEDVGEELGGIHNLALPGTWQALMSRVIV